MDNTPEDHILIQDGQVMMVRNGQMSQLEEEITLLDGTRVGLDGTVMMPDGSIRTLAEGETIMLQGAAAGPEHLTDQQFKEAMEDEELRDQLH